MGRLLTNKALEPPAALRPSVPRKPATAPFAPAPKVVPATGSSTIAPPPSAEERQNSIEVNNPLRKIAFYSGLGFLFIKFGAVSDLLVLYGGVNTYIMYAFAPLAVLGVLTTGGIGRAFRANATKYWIAFFFWMVLATPFSIWRGDSAHLLMNYGRVQLVLLFITAGLAMTWKEIRMVLYTMSAAAIVNLATARFLTQYDAEGRIKFESDGNIGNANDFGAHLLLVLSFLLFVVLDKSRNKILRISLMPFLAYGLWVVLRTGSRGCMIALVGMFLFALWRATSAQRITILIVGITLAVLAPMLLPGSIVTRLSSLAFDNDSALANAETGTNEEAFESSSVRQYLLRQSILYTIQHPIFGVGPGQFSVYEGSKQNEAGKRGSWHETHNFLTQVSSECGIPALVFVLMGIGSAFLMVNRTYRRAKKAGFQEIAIACFCYQLGMVGYVISIVFLAQAYHAYLPTMVGLAISMSLIAAREMSRRESAAPLMARPPLGQPARWMAG